MPSARMSIFFERACPGRLARRPARCIRALLKNKNKHRSSNKPITSKYFLLIINLIVVIHLHKMEALLFFEKIKKDTCTMHAAIHSWPLQAITQQNIATNQKATDSQTNNEAFILSSPPPTHTTATFDRCRNHALPLMQPQRYGSFQILSC